MQFLTRVSLGCCNRPPLSAGEIAITPSPFPRAIFAIGILLCVVWFLGIRSYKHISSAKFAAINNIIGSGSNPFEIEWKNLKSNKKYVPITLIESCVPIMLAISFLILIFI